MEGLPRPLADGKAERVLPWHRHGQVPAHVIQVALRTDRDNAADRDAAVVKHGQVARPQNRLVGLAQNRRRVTEIDLDETDGRSVAIITTGKIDAEPVAFQMFRNWVRRVCTHPGFASIRRVDVAQLPPFHDLPSVSSRTAEAPAFTSRSSHSCTLTPAFDAARFHRALASTVTPSRTPK